MILSNFESVKQIATEMERASYSIQNATNKSITTSDKTTLTVNRAAQESNKKSIQLIGLFHQEFQRVIQDIHSVATEFERTDQELDNSINNLTPSLDLSKDINTYNKAKNG